MKKPEEVSVTFDFIDIAMSQSNLKFERKERGYHQKIVQKFEDDGKTKIFDQFLSYSDR